jgi:hypothetical protein
VGRGPAESETRIGQTAAAAIASGSCRTAQGELSALTDRRGLRGVTLVSADAGEGLKAKAAKAL